jgi:hypothetical protein
MEGKPGMILGQGILLQGNGDEGMEDIDRRSYYICCCQ